MGTESQQGSDTSMKPLICVVVPCYRHDPDLAATLASISDAFIDDGTMKVVLLNNKPEKTYAKELLEEHQYPFHYVENPQTLPLNDNWNRCIEIADGEWVHLLHEDDKVMPDFYRRFCAAVESGETFSAFFSQQFYINEIDKITSVSKLLSKESGILAEAAKVQISTNAIIPPSIMVKKSLYDRIGVFRTDLVHVLDWEMWYRICINDPVWYEAEPLVCYRVHGQQETVGIVESGESALDMIRGVDRVKVYCPPAHLELAKAYGEKYIILCAYNLIRFGKVDAAMRQLKILFKWRPAALWNERALKVCFWASKSYLKRLFKKG